MFEGHDATLPCAFAWFTPMRHIFFTAVISVLTCHLAQAADLTFLYPNAMRPALTNYLPEFEANEGVKLQIRNDSVGALADAVEQGAQADVVIVTAPQMDELEARGKIVRGTRKDITKVGIGVGIRKGDPKPDVSTVEAFKQTLLDAKSIGYDGKGTGSAVGNYMPGLLERLGIAKKLEAKTWLTPSIGHPLYAAVSEGVIQLGFGQMSDVLDTKSMDLVGPLPEPIQNYTLFVAGVTTTSRQVKADKDLIAFLSTPQAAALLKEKGFWAPHDKP